MPFMSEIFYANCPSLHSSLKFVSKTKYSLVGNGQYVSVLFLIPVVINLHGHRYEIYTLVTGIHDNVDMVMGIRDVYEIKGLISTRDSCYIS